MGEDTQQYTGFFSRAYAFCKQHAYVSAGLCGGAALLALFMAVRGDRAAEQRGYEALRQQQYEHQQKKEKRLQKAKRTIVERVLYRSEKYATPVVDRVVNGEDPQPTLESRVTPD